jgi:hypothetical protein
LRGGSSFIYLYQLKSLIERLPEVEKVMEKDRPAEEEIRSLEEKRRRGEIPLMIISRKTAVELVKEGRGGLTLLMPSFLKAHFA